MTERFERLSWLQRADNNGNVILGQNGLPISDPSVDRFGNPLTVTTLNTANYDDIVSTFAAIETALHGVPFTTGGINQVATGANGSSFTPMPNNAFFLQYSQTIPNSVGDSAFGNPAFSLQGATGPGGRATGHGILASENGRFEFTVSG